MSRPLATPLGVAIAIPIAIALAAPAVAQTADTAATEARTLDTVIVTGTRATDLNTNGVNVPGVVGTGVQPQSGVTARADDQQIRAPVSGEVTEHVRRGERGDIDADVGDFAVVSG